MPGDKEIMSKLCSEDKIRRSGVQPGAGCRIVYTGSTMELSMRGFELR